LLPSAIRKPKKKTKEKKEDVKKEKKKKKKKRVFIRIEISISRGREGGAYKRKERRLPFYLPTLLFVAQKR